MSALINAKELTPEMREMYGVPPLDRPRQNGKTKDKPCRRLTGRQVRTRALKLIGTLSDIDNKDDRVRVLMQALRVNDV